tara:strand:+ start:16255 stop:17160 length:906 start_codon:yes stop_codon:yes gene_type:complete
MTHDHQISAKQGDKRVGVAIVANLVLTAAQVVGGILAGSLSLIADALHNFSDVASLAIAFGARKIARRPADPRMTFGYGRIELVAALINYTTLIVVGIYLVYEGGMRFIDPPEVKGWIVVVLGSVALGVDALTALLTWSMQKNSMNIRALFLHNLSDALASIAVIVGGSFILLYDIRWIDPLITILIAAYILYLAFSEIGGVIRILMLGSPPDIDTDAVLDAVADVDGVAGVHHAHFWQMGEHEAALDTHVVLATDRWGNLEEIKQAIKLCLKNKFGIDHSTLEFERAENQHDDASRYGHG